MDDTTPPAAWLIDQATDRYQQDGLVEIDDDLDGPISRSDHGAWVPARVWVPYPDPD